MCISPFWGIRELRGSTPTQLGTIGSGQAVAYGVDSGFHSNLPKSWGGDTWPTDVGEGTHHSVLAQTSRVYRLSPGVLG